jgi:hypothetical protein
MSPSWMSKWFSYLELVFRGRLVIIPFSLQAIALPTSVGDTLAYLLHMPLGGQLALSSYFRISHSAEAGRFLLT